MIFIHTSVETFIKGKSFLQTKIENVRQPLSTIETLVYGQTSPDTAYCISFIEVILK